MSEISVIAKIEFILSMMDNIDTIIMRHKTLDKALTDEVEARPAILMSILQIGETLNRLPVEIIDKYDLKKDIKGSYDVRNFIAHNYEGVDIHLIEELISTYFPILKKILNTMIIDFK